VRTEFRPAGFKLPHCGPREAELVHALGVMGDHRQAHFHDRSDERLGATHLQEIVDGVLADAMEDKPLFPGIA